MPQGTTDSVGVGVGVPKPEDPEPQPRDVCMYTYCSLTTAIKLIGLT